MQEGLAFEEARSMSFIRRRSSIAHFRAIALVGAASAATSIAAGVAHADGRLAARYTMSVGGVPVGKSDLKVAIGSIEYAVSVSGHASGMLRALVSGEGSLTTRGAIVDGHLVPTTFSSSTSEAHHKAGVTMTLDGGIVKDLPTQTGSSAADRVALTAEHRKGVIDPMTALLVTVDGAGDVIGPDACQRTLPIFDGRRRYDLKLSFRRIDSVQTERGYRGQAVVCGVTFQAIAGHRASSPL